MHVSVTPNWAKRAEWQAKRFLGRPQHIHVRQKAQSLKNFDPLQKERQVAGSSNVV